jgi:hypothetical protein
MAEESAQQRLNLAQFASLEDAIAKVAAAIAYDEIAAHFLSGENIEATALPVVFFSSMINRCNSLHTAIVREMEAETPHAVFPLIRTYAEGAALMIYVYDHVNYIESLLDRPWERDPNAPARLTVGRLVAYAVKHAAPGFKQVYDELSDFTHFGSTAMWSPFVLATDGGSYSWTSRPRWRNDEQAMTAAAMTLEVADALHTLFGNFGRKYVS